MTRAEKIRALLDEYARQRVKNEQERLQREREAFARDPQLALLREQSVRTATQAMRAAMDEPDCAKRRRIAEDMLERGLRINAEQRVRLRALGLSEDYLEERYRCPLCRDTGYVGQAPARFCSCFEKRLAAMDQGPLCGQTFENFDPSVVPEEGGQRAQLLEVRDLLREFADCYPNARWSNVVLMGAGGLGKSFLLNCVYARVLERERAAVRVTAFRMFDAMRRRHMNPDDEFDPFAPFLEAPLLLIDDLGTEPLMRNITVEYLFLLFNERMEAGLSTMVTTNLNTRQLGDRYGERVVSRLFDKARALAIRLEGKDLRLYAKREG